MSTKKKIRLADRSRGGKIYGRSVNALKDVPDVRDRLYEPTLSPLKRKLPRPEKLVVLDQGQHNACTGFALAAVIHRLMTLNPTSDAATRARVVSPHMLYLNARRHDEWAGERDEGSSLRGALRGFYNNGVCKLNLWPTQTAKEFSLEAAKDARLTSLGAYYRLRPQLSDYHAAICETGAIYASAAVHKGWDNPKKGGVIEPGPGKPLHAFAIVGYDDLGFWIQNSWGKAWGTGGLAHWSYEDWSANIEDAWVLQLAIPSAACFGLGLSRGELRNAADMSRAKRAKPSRQDIAGHFVHVNNGDFSSAPPYWSDAADVAATAQLIGETKNYDHFLFYAHGGLNAPDEAAIRTAAMVDVFTANRIYPYSVFYDTGLLKTIKDLIMVRGDEVTARTGGLLDLTDALIEKAIGSVGMSLWDEMKRDARLPFEAGRAGEKAIKLFVEQLKKRDPKKPIQIHLVGHSTGAILIGHLLTALDRVLPEGATIDSCSLMAPACSIEFFHDHYAPRLTKAGALQTKIGRFRIYNLTDEVEQADSVTSLYNKSLLYLVSNAFERVKGTTILGLERDKKQIKAKVDIQYAGEQSVTRSETHGGFDNDPSTMNDILKRILGTTPVRPFTDTDLGF